MKDIDIVELGSRQEHKDNTQITKSKATVTMENISYNFTIQFRQQKTKRVANKA